MTVPVLLVHGFLASPGLMKPMEWRLQRRGRTVVTPHLAPLALRDVRHHAGELDGAIDRVRTTHGTERVDVVGVSQGGLIALWWAMHRGGWPRVRRLCLVGAPVGGTWAALAGVPLLGAFSRGIWQLLPSSDLVRELTAPVPSDAAVTTIALARDPLCTPANCAVVGADNRVVPGGPGPMSHQWLMFSAGVSEAVLGALDPSHGQRGADT